MTDSRFVDRTHPARGRTPSSARTTPAAGTSTARTPESPGPKSTGPAGSTSYDLAIELASRDIVAAYRDAPDRTTAQRIARNVTVWLSGIYGHAAIRDLAERLAHQLADVITHTTAPPIPPAGH
ncbi:hypothetical protein GCM10009836_72480 [Pseudonocardia ailaonensis]|uniref:Uncharacterized protein n=1 Tax=Pseudonocardia ailaonensis TaxID=367279 RepID=A0ABN2NTN8_9PSEU